MKFLKALFGFIIIVIVLLVAIGGYLGFVPGVSKLFGSDKPRDLGVSPSQAQFDVYISQHRVVRESLSDDSPVIQSVVYEGSHPVEDSFTSEGITSYLQLNPNKWKYDPFRQVQVRINPDNSVEISAKADLEKLVQLGIFLGAPEAAMRQGIEKFHLSGAGIPVYLKATASITNNSGQADIQSLEVGRLTIPQNLVKQYEPIAESAIMNKLGTIPGFSAEEAEFRDSKLFFKGMLPDKVKAVTDER